MITVFGYLGHIDERLREAAAAAEIVVGGRRHLEAAGVPQDRRIVLGKVEPAVERLKQLPPDRDAVVIASGDPLLFGIVRTLRGAGLEVRVVPAPSSIAAAFAAVAVPWDDAVIVTLHGNSAAGVGAAVLICRSNAKVGVLTAPGRGLNELAADLENRWFVLAERLGEADERVRVLTASQAREVTVGEPNVVLVLAHAPDDPRVVGQTPSVMGRPDPPERPGPGRPPRIGQSVNGMAAHRMADRIDAILGEPTLRYEGPATQQLPTAWDECDLIISHLALGATTRLIAPLLRSKSSDPGVVVVDEAGRFVVPLVGGHGGGANDLAVRLGAGLGATAVVTTATDSLGIPALDTLGWAYRGDVASVTRAILDGRPVRLERTRAWPLPALPENVTEDCAEPAARILVTDAEVTNAEAGGTLPTVVLHPKSLVVGMGCNRGTPTGQLRELLLDTLERAGLAAASVSVLTSVDAKADEPGLIELAAELGIDFRTHSAESLAGVTVPNPSAVVAGHVGSPSVCEASVVLHHAELLVEKQRSSDATCAIGLLPVLGRLCVVGLGPGSRDLVTPRAVAAISAASVVVGYAPYVEQIKDLIRPGTRVIASGMGTEEQRTAVAIEQARQGRAVALVCSGDPAIYAMASPVLEQGTEGIEVDIIPGVTASLAVSSILGAPLGHDHATISLSDLHTAWDHIERRLRAAAEADLVTVLYNPRSRTRQRHLPRALEIMAKHRPPTTPVAVVHEACRPDQRVTASTLSSFDPEWVDMNSLVVIGSSTTRYVPTGIGERFMVTPRDYQWMSP